MTVKLDSGKAIQVDGTLIAKGSSSEKITFTRNSGDNWGYILFSDVSNDAIYDSSGNYSSGSIMEYCVVEYAGGSSVSNNGAVRMNSAHPFINYCTIQNNSASGINAYNISGTLKITKSTIMDNESSSSSLSSSFGGGVSLSHSSGGTTKISDNTIKNNTASYRGGGIFTEGGTVTITNNTISGNKMSSYTSHHGGGIFVNNGTVTITNNTISGNTASSSSSSLGGGIHASGTVTIASNVISGNTASSSGGGIYAGATVTITSNIISGNTSSSSYGGGIYGGGVISKNSLTGNIAKNNAAVYYPSGDNKDFKYNVITGNKADDTTVSISSNPLFNYNNIFSNTALYDLWYGKSQNSSNLNAENNWWGSSDDATVQGKIYDFIDDSTKALVDYLPYDTAIRTDCPISPPTGLTATAGTNYINLTWTANSESDTKGYKVYWDTDSGHSYANSVDVGNVTSYTITGLTGSKYYVTVTAYDTDYSSASDDSSTIVNENMTNGNESWYAEEKAVTLTSSDTTPPTGSLSINSDAAYTKSTSVTLALSATDGVGVTGYYLSESSTTPLASASGWTTVSSTTSYSSSISYTPSSGDSNKTVYVWYKDAAENVSSSASDTITLDTTAPTITITSPTSSSTYTTTSSTMSLGGSASDSTSGVSSVTWSSDKGSSGTASGTTSWSISKISLSSGDNAITVTATDNAGNTRTDVITGTYTFSNSSAGTWTQLMQNGTSIGGMAYAYDSNRNRGVIFGGDNSSLNQLSSTHEWNGTSWTLITSSGPSSRVNVAMAFDTIRGKSVLFGGWVKPDNYQGDTWTWDGTQWSQVSSTGPYARANQAMTFDSSRGKVVLFGGSYYQTIYGDTWEWDGTSWTQVSSSGPSSRLFARMAYDEARGKVVLFGGQTTYYGTFLNDTWEWDGTSWQQVATTGPSARSWHTMAYDSTGQRVVLFGGGGWGRAESFNDLWEWNGTSWVQINASGPSARIGASLFYDKTLNAMILYGGYNNGSNYSTLGDTWKYSSTSPSPTPTVITSPSLSPSPSITTTPKPTPSPTLSPSEGTIYGFVKDDEDESPLKNVSISLTGPDNYAGSIKTDDTGFYIFEELAAGDYTLEASKSGYQTHTEDLPLGEGEELEVETIYLEEIPCGSMYGYVLDISGDPVENVKLRLRGLGKGKHIKCRTVSDKDGFFEFSEDNCECLEEGKYVITVKKKRYRATQKTVEIEEGEEKDIEILINRKSQKMKILSEEETE